MIQPWKIKLFGGLRAEPGEPGAPRVITRFRTHNTGALLAYLAYHRGRSHPREVLIDLLWPEAVPRSGRNSLSMALSSLRNQFEPPGTPTGSVLVADRLSVELNPAAFTTDVAVFEQTLRLAAQVGDEVTRRQHLTEAVDLYGGALLPGYYQAWIVPEQERLAERFVEALHQLARSLQRAGELAPALEYARRAVAVDPLREEAHGDLLRLLLAAGQTRQARQQYRELERVLAEELGAEPSAASRQLFRQIEADLAAGQGPVDVPPPSPLPRSSVAAPAPVVPLPSGTVTFLLTDIEGSTALWERLGEPFRAVLHRHHELLRGAFRRYGGQEVNEAGDAFVVAFAAAADALSCAVACQRALAAEGWPAEVGTLRVRMALHAGDIPLEAGEGYHGPVLNRASRILSAGHGGQILLSEALGALVRRDLEGGVRLTDLGVYRLRGVDLPERLFQLEWPEMAVREFPPLAAERARSGSLPLQFTRFFGREPEIEQIEALLRSGEVRLLTLTGPGGTGKTRLAIEAAGRLVDWLAGAIWFVPLADLSDPALIAGTIVDALQLPRSGEVAPFEQAVAALSGQPSLLILDNFEQLVEGGAELVQALLGRAPMLRCLVTSRQVLNLPGEREYAVSPLPTPHGDSSLVRLGAYECVQLFVDRAQAVKPDFQVTNGNAAAVAELCDRLEGIPLAIELAAARAQVLTPMQMLAQLSQRFEFLVGRRRGVAERQRTLRATLDWSYRLLSPELQRFFAHLSVFRGGWTAEAAEAVCDEPLALDYLAQLRECSLVLSEEVALGGLPEMRFSMLETLREYGQERLLDSGGAELVRGQHRDWFLELAEQAQGKLYGPEETAWLNRLETEHDNLRAALGWCGEEAEGAEAGFRLVGSLLDFWWLHGHYSEGRERLSLALSRAVEPTQARADTLRAAAYLAFLQGDLTVVRAYCEEALSICQKLANKIGVVNMSLGLAELAASQSDYATAGVLLEEALAVSRETGSNHCVAEVLSSLGYLAHCQGDLAVARSFCEEGLALKRDIGNKQDIAYALRDLGILYRDQGDPAAACSLIEEALAMLRELGDKQGCALLLVSLGGLVRKQGDFQRAHALYEECLALDQERNVKGGEVLGALGYLAADEGDYVGARRLWTMSLTEDKELGFQRGIARDLEGFADLYRKQGQAERAARLLGAAETLRRTAGATLRSQWRPDYERVLSDTRAALSAEAFAQAWAEGGAIPLEQAVAYALEDDAENRA